MKKSLSRKKVLKEAVVLLIAVAMFLSAVTVTANTKITKQTISTVEKSVLMNRDVLFEDNFESYADFVIDFPPWTNIDVDGSDTFGSNQHTWPNQWLPQAYIIFNPSATSPPWTDPLIQPHSGAKFAGCFNDNNAGYLSDDWLITPLLGPSNYDEVSFWAKSFTNMYNLERFEVGISTTNTDPASFTIISAAPYVVPPYETWTQYNYNLDNYDNQAIYIGIHMMSADSWLFMVDDFSVTGTTHVPEPAICCEGTLHWENVSAGGTVTGTFRVCNCGEPGSLLNWEVDTWPTWGTWTFTPNSGTGLAEGDCVTITVQVVAPPDEETEFTGKIKMINSDDPTDFCEIDVYLKTPIPKSLDTLNTVIQKIFARNQNLSPIIRQIMMQ